MSEVINILLVDDERRNLDALEAILDDPGYRLLRAEGADKALRLLLEHDVAAIVLDIKMPVVSGFELAKMIKGSKKFRQIPLLFLTAHLLDDQDVVSGYDAGAIDYLTKPVNPAILRHKVATFADLFRKTRALAELNATLEQRVQERTAELERSEAALRAADKQKDTFLATLAHELRNPLAPLRTGLDILLSQPDPPALVAHTLAAMNRQLSHIVRLIDDLLDVSRVSRGLLEIRMERADLARVVERAIETAQPLLTRNQQTVRVVSTGPISAVVDATRITQVIGNLINNAAKHSQIGATVRIELEQKADQITIQVIDQGIGIPEDQLDRVFDMFSKIERQAPRTNDGLGIGLALSRQLAEMHGGTLYAQSAGEGRGATFTLSLPMREERPPASPETASIAAPRTNSADPLRVVVVEDNEDTAELMALWLEGLGHEVHVLRDGAHGVSVILESQPDLVLCDIGLPDMDGMEVCRRILAGMPKPPVMVALTGWGAENDRKRTFDAGFQHHLVKPVAMDELRRILDRLPRAQA